MAVFEFTNVTTFKAAFADPYFTDVTGPDSETFLDRSGGVLTSSNVTMGIVKRVVKKGKIVLGRADDDDE